MKVRRAISELSLFFFGPLVAHHPFVVAVKTKLIEIILVSTGEFVGKVLDQKFWSHRAMNFVTGSATFCYYRGVFGCSLDQLFFYVLMAVETYHIRFANK